jgi:hypothetical protein
MERRSGMRNAPKKAAQSVSPEAIASEISRLAGLPLTELKAAWRAEFRLDVPKGLSRDLLTRTLAWHLQERAFGGHDAATLKLLKAFALQDADKVVLFRKLKPGTTVVREYQGVRHIVTITEGGFVWEGRTYSSLSAIALAITGAKWNGPRFFGLRDPNTGRPARKAS